MTSDLNSTYLPSLFVGPSLDKKVPFVLEKLLTKAFGLETKLILSKIKCRMKRK